MTASDNLSRFRVTTWPGMAVPIPTAVRFPCRVAAEGVVLFEDAPLSGQSRWGAPPPHNLRVQLPEELYLRAFRRLNTADSDAIASFANNWGALDTPWEAVIPPEWLPGYGAGIVDSHVRYFVESSFPAVSALMRAESLLGDDSDELGFLVDSFRMKAGLLRDAIRLWGSVTGVVGEQTVETEWESSWAYRLGNLDDAMSEFFIPLINRALSPFTMRVMPVEDVASPHEGRNYSTYNLLALQLSNDVATNSDLHVCQRCEQLFIKQDGRAIHGQGRKTGSKYCSKTCASAAASASYRERRRTKTSGGR